ncbi:MAG: hypothetical protein IT406_03550 [Candidatus Yanofskybacteria bacterium]|nr:hypothetical protein [Candidatus Yanofskybacteria bacterium]
MTTVLGYHSADEFFRDALTAAMQRERIHVSALAEFYLTTLLARPAGWSARSGLPLSTRFVQAIGMPHTSAERARLLREVGDDALTSFVWWQLESRRRSGSLALYRHLGERAYLHCGACPFHELGTKFRRISDAMARCGTALGALRPPDVLRLYELWAETGSEYAARAVTELGLFFAGSGDAHD